MADYDILWHLQVNQVWYKEAYGSNFTLLLIITKNNMINVVKKNTVNIQTHIQINRQILF